MCSPFIQKHIRELPTTEIFTTREMLQYGTRGAVDQALRRLVNAKFIVRLTGGVFVRDASLSPSLEEIAKAKMAAWNKVLFTHAEDLLIEMELLPARSEASFMMAVNSHSSSFETIEGRVHLKGIGNRRARLCLNKAGRIAYALWHLTECFCTQEHVSVATEGLTRTEREDLRLASAMMPAWLSDLCRYRFPAPRVTV